MKIMHVYTCLAMQTMPNRVASYWVYFIHKMCTHVHKIAPTKCARTKQQHEIAEKTWSYSLLLSEVTFILHLSSTNCWRQFYLELGFYFMIYILLSHIISSILCWKIPLSSCHDARVYVYMWVCVCLHVCVCVCVSFGFFLSAILDPIKSCWNCYEFLDWKC